jgi:IS30 family transposase
MQLVTRANRWLVEKRKPDRRAPYRVTRNHLSKPVCSSPGRAEEGIAAIPEISPSNPSIEACQPETESKDMVSISERPVSVEDRAVPGHWEGDLIGGSKNSYIATLVERYSRYVMLAKVKNKDTESVVSALIKQSKKLPDELYKSLTWDRGKELADHQRFTLETDVDVYFCDPQSPWQRGSNENTNGLLRQYFPKGTDLSVHSQARLNAVARQLNERPRKTLGFETPAERFNACVASTG